MIYKRSLKIIVFLALLLAILNTGCLSETTPSTPSPTLTEAPTVTEEVSPTLVITTIPRQVSEISEIRISWSVSGEGIRGTHNAIHYGSESNAGAYGTEVAPPAGYPTMTTEFAKGDFELPMDFSTTITPEGPGTIYLRAHAIIEGNNYWSDEKAVVVSIEEEHHDEEHAIPKEATDLVNPISSSESSLARGQELYTENCVSCHGSEGRGDGHMAMMLEPRPSNLHEAHVQENPDSVLFYIISNGEEGTAMPAFTQISEEDRWNIVNYLRIFELEEGGAGKEEGHAPH